MLLQTHSIDPSPWPSVIVAVALLTLITVVTVVAIKKFSTVDDVLKILGVFAGVLGVVTGSMVTYFFTRQPLADAKHQVHVLGQELEEAEKNMASIMHLIETEVGPDAAQTLLKKFEHYQERNREFSTAEASAE